MKLELGTFSIVLFFMACVAYILSAIMPVVPVENTTFAAIVIGAILVWHSGNIIEATRFQWPIRSGLILIGGTFLWMAFFTDQDPRFLPTLIPILCAALIATPQSDAYDEIVERERSAPSTPVHALEPKFQKFHDISRMFRDAPHPVRRAWREGWTDIELIPQQEYVPADTNKLEIIPAGWWGDRPVESSFDTGTAIRYKQWTRICLADGSCPFFEGSRGTPAD